MEQKKILLIEDEEDIIGFVSYYFRKRGFDVISALDGISGLEMVRTEKPDIILLDLMLPRRNGMDVCHDIINDPELFHIPVIMLTARSENSDIVKGLESGAVDYVTKPFSCAELCARINRHLDNTKSMNKESLDSEAVKKLAEEKISRYVDIVKHSDRLSSLGAMVLGLVHEINNANTYIYGNADILNGIVPAVLKLAEKYPDEIDPGRLEHVKDIQMIADDITHGSQLINDLVECFGKYGKRSFRARPNIEKANVKRAVSDAIKFTKYGGYKQCAVVAVDIDTNDYFVKMQQRELEQVFINLLTNSFDAILERKGRKIDFPGRVGIKVRGDENNVYIDVTDNGIGIRKELHSEIFSNFFTTKAEEKGTGLGLGIIKEILDRVGAYITFFSEPGVGTIFNMKVPAYIEKEQKFDVPDMSMDMALT